MRLTKSIIMTGIAFACSSVMAFASDQGHGSVTFTGSIIDSPCSITPDSIDQTINLGEISNKALENGGKSTPVPFDIKLDSCDLSALTDKTVNITFTGTESNALKGYLAIAGTASGASVAITNDDGINIPVGTASQPIKTQRGSNLLNFSAYLQGNNASAGVIPGTFTSVANFTLAYQ